MIEDAAHALGALTPDGPVGNCARSDMCCFSFHPVKADHDRRGRRGHHQRRRARRRACAGSATTASCAGPSGAAGTTRSTTLGLQLPAHRHPGRPRAPASWRKLDRFIARRNELADRYRDAARRPARRAAAGGAAGLAPRPTTCSPSGSPTAGGSTTALRAAGIGAQVHYVPIHRHPLFADAGAPRRLPGHRRGLRAAPLAPAVPRPHRGRAGHGRRARWRRCCETSTRPRRWWARAAAGHPAAAPRRCPRARRQFVQGVSPDLPASGAGAPTSGTSTATSSSTTPWPSARCSSATPSRSSTTPSAAQLDDGITFTLMHPLEVEVAERIVGLCPGVEAVRFGKSGSDAVTAAVRAARAYTGRDQVLVGGYHGWHDWYIGSTTRNRGVPAGGRGAHVDLRLQRPRRPRRALGRPPGRGRRRRRSSRRGARHAGRRLPRRASSTWPARTARCPSSTRSSPASGSRPAAPASATASIPTSPATARPSATACRSPPSPARGQVMRVFEEIFFSGTHGGETLSLAAARRRARRHRRRRRARRHRRRWASRMLSGLARAWSQRHGVGDRVARRRRAGTVRRRLRAATTTSSSRAGCSSA